jgi:ketosteroid isomerase-like protein
LNHNLSLTLKAYEASLRGSYEDFLALLHPQIRITLPASLPHGGSYQGKEGARQLRRNLLAAWSDFRVDILEHLVGADSVVTVIGLKAVSKATGRHVDTKIAEFWRFRDRQVVELSAYYFDTKAVFDACTQQP